MHQRVRGAGRVGPRRQGRRARRCVVEQRRLAEPGRARGGAIALSGGWRRRGQDGEQEQKGGGERQRRHLEAGSHTAGENYGKIYYALRSGTVMERTVLI